MGKMTEKKAEGAVDEKADMLVADDKAAAVDPLLAAIATAKANPGAHIAVPEHGVSVIDLSAQLPPSLPETLRATPWIGNEKCVPTELVAHLSADELEALGYARARVGLGGTILRRF